LQANINANTSAINNETARATGVESGLQTSINLKAPSYNPTFSGTVTNTGTIIAPNVEINDNSAKVATTYAVKQVTDLLATKTDPVLAGVADISELIAVSFGLAKWKSVGVSISSKAGNEQFGDSVSMSNDGKTVIVGAPDHPNNKGQARVFDFNSSTAEWVQRGGDIVGISTGDLCGTSVDISYDGNVIIVGSSDYQGIFGMARVFYWDTVTNPSDHRWTQRGENFLGNAHSYSGNSVSISANGNIAVMGSVAGGLKVFIWNGTLWDSYGTMNSYDVRHGFSVSLSGDGTRLVVGAPLAHVNKWENGKATVYERNGNEWVQLGLSFPGDSANDQFGYSVSISNDGNTVAIGSRASFVDGKGYVYVYYWDIISTPGTPKWSLLGAKLSGEAANDQSGWCVSLSGDGTVVAIGSPVNDGNTINSDKGSVRVYELDAVTTPLNPSWVLRVGDMDGVSANERYGSSVSLSGDGSIVAIGAPFNNAMGNASGVVRVSEYNGSKGSLYKAELGYLRGVTSSIQPQLNLKAPVASPAFTGTVTAPTVENIDNSTKVATTAYVKAVVGDLINGAPAALDSIGFRG
jgi:hypothetical protein